MTEPIKKGDLVMVVKPTPCCGNAGSLGRVFRVGSLRAFTGWCLRCGLRGDPSVDVALPHRSLEGAQLSRLIKIDPPALPEGVETTKGVTA